MTSDASAFANEWIAGWNERDIDAILARYAPGVVFRSARAAELTGTGELRGIDELREYFLRVLDRSPVLEFQLREVIADGNRVVLLFDARVNDRYVAACETFRFDGEGRVVESAAYKGAPLAT